jgi:hypothetical protein
MLVANADAHDLELAAFLDDALADIAGDGE